MGTRIIAKATLQGYATDYPDAADDLQDWHTLLAKSDFSNWAQLKQIVPSASLVNSEFVVFNIRGNRYRLITRVWFNGKTLYIKHLLTHADYDRWSDEQRKQ